MSRKPVRTIMAAVVLMAMTITAVAQDTITDKKAWEISMLRNGDVRIVEYAWNSAYMTFEPVADPAAGKRSFGSAVIERMVRWKQQNKKVFFNFTKEAKKSRGKINTVFTKYVKKRRGVNSSPIPRTQAKTLPVKGLNQFNNIFEYQRQFENDDNNTIVMTTDDNFFKNPLGNLNDPDLIGRTWVLSTATFTEKNGKFRGTYYIEEVDIFLRSDFFDFNKSVYEPVLTGLARYGFGYVSNLAVWDLNGENKAFTYNMFKNKNKEMWKKLAMEWDRAFYSSAITEAAANDYIVIPDDGFVLDLADYEVPDTDPDNPSPTSNTSALFVTNLLAFDGGKKLTAKFVAKYPDPDDPDKTITRKIFNIANNAYDYPGDISGTKVYPTIWMNSIKFGRAGELNKLKKFVRKYGTPKNIEGESYEKALKVAVTIVGRESENSGKKKKTVTVFFVNSEEEDD